MQIANKNLFKNTLTLGLLLLTLFLASVVSSAEAGSESDGIDPIQETMLMFVGEELPTATVASRQPEEPAAAPAMITVVSREEIDNHGYQTLAQLLASQPGFFMALRGRGTVSYLRGLPDSVLFLYDGVPITTDVTKNLSVLDREISLAPISRVEISRGPGSILWGADAFAGVVNLVPFRGRQRPGVETGFQAGTSLWNITAAWGISHKKWDSFLSLSADTEKYQSPNYTTQESVDSLVTDTVGLSDHKELVGTLNYGNWLQISGRWSDFTRRYTMETVSGNINWPGEKRAPVNLLKATVSKVVGPSHYSLMGFIQEIDYLSRDANVGREQQSWMNHLEILWDRRLFSRGLLTAGSSWRKNMVSGAVVREGFLPDFLVPELPLFVPQVSQANFDSERFSFFAQGRYRWGKTECWAGGRLDDHNQYGSTNTYSLGFNTMLADSLRLKSTFGNAFRSPFSSQLFDDQQFKPESILTTSAQLSWTPKVNYLLEITIFSSTLENHRTEDPYGGLSQSSNPEVQGAELRGSMPLGRTVELRLGVTAMLPNNNEEQFRTSNSFIRPDGTSVELFDEWTQPFDQGPLWLANLSLNWQIGTAHNLMVSGRISDEQTYSYEKNTVTGNYNQPLLLDITYRRPGFSNGHDYLTLTATNLLNKNYQIPDTFGPTTAPPLQISLTWQYHF